MHCTDLTHSHAGQPVLVPLQDAEASLTGAPTPDPARLWLPRQPFISSTARLSPFGQREADGTLRANHSLGILVDLIIAHQALQ